MSHTAFFYGTLMAPEVLSRVVFGGTGHPNASRLTVKPAILSDYRRHRVMGCDYPAIVPKESFSVRGSYVTGLRDSDLIRLDIFEGSQYSREKVKVKVLKEDVGFDAEVSDNAEGDEREAQTYVWKDGHGELEEKEWDFGHFRKERMRRWMGQGGSYEREDEDHVEVDEGFADVDKAMEKDTAEQDPTGGRGANGHISERLNAYKDDEV